MAPEDARDSLVFTYGEFQKNLRIFASYVLLDFFVNRYLGKAKS